MERISTPDFLYGTAWKEDLTAKCLLDALRAGFRAIDTANQRKHYFEEGVGAALKEARASLGLTREDLFLQTKFTFARGQDHRKPYDDTAAFPIQVRQSLESSLAHLHTDRIDSLLLHGPMTAAGLTAADWDVWGEMEKLCQSGKVLSIGVSNFSADQLETLLEDATIKPRFVQNRCFAEMGWDHDVRALCRAHGIFYQGFSLLTANGQFLGGQVARPKDRNTPQLILAGTLHSEIQKIVAETGKSISQVVFRFCQQIGMIPITGTRSFDHMKADLDIQDFSLTSEQLQTLETIASLD